MYTTFLSALALGCLLLFACLFDLRQRCIPNRLLAIGLLAALVLQLGSGPPSALLTSYLARLRPRSAHVSSALFARWYGG
ncbi:hypothetical protein LP419_18250 [Massilia sp. H-1]|nr:hypothetical protein LP419_18250 [Massilia sp. H-1]